MTRSRWGTWRTWRRLRHRLAGRLPNRDDERGSLAMAMMAVLVGATLGALILPMVISQNQSTRFDITRVHSLHAAQTGADVLLGKIRSSTKTVNGTALGDPSTLPCGLSGNANDGGTYTVTVTYWRDSPLAGGSPMACRPGFGTYATDSEGAPVSTPRYAVITSTGRDGTVDSGSRGRTIVSTFSLRTDDTNIPGGLIRLFPNSGSTDKWCMDAGSPVPAVNTQLKLGVCSSLTPPLAQQVFAYRVDLSIQLVSSVTTTNPNGLCIDTPTTTPITPHAANQKVVLNKCAVVTAGKCPSTTTCSPYYQQWSINDNAHLEGAKASPLDTDGFCVNAPSQTGTTPLPPLTVSPCVGDKTSGSQAWVPSPTVGAGMAGTGAGNDQLVNFRQFGKCLDIPVNGTSLAVLQLFSCKQNPDPTKVSPNQTFTPTPRPALTAGPTTVLFKTIGTNCLRSPQTTADGVNQVSAASCPGSLSEGSVWAWTVYQTKDAAGDDLPYSKKFTIVDGRGYCLSVGRDDDLRKGDDGQPTLYNKAVVNPCDGSTAQKWNAAASLGGGQLSNTYECPPPSSPPSSPSASPSRCVQ